MLRWIGCSIRWILRRCLRYRLCCNTHYIWDWWVRWGLICNGIDAWWGGLGECSLRHIFGCRYRTWWPRWGQAPSPHWWRGVSTVRYVVTCYSPSLPIFSTPHLRVVARWGKWLFHDGVYFNQLPYLLRAKYTLTWNNICGIYVGTIPHIRGYDTTYIFPIKKGVQRYSAMIGHQIICLNGCWVRHGHISW